jgi:hypothetical protein
VPAAGDLWLGWGRRAAHSCMVDELLGEKETLCGEAIVEEALGQ